MKKQKRKSAKVKGGRRRKHRPDYALQGTSLDIPTATVLGFSKQKRRKYIFDLLTELASLSRKNKLSLKQKISSEKAKTSAPTDDCITE